MSNDLAVLEPVQLPSTERKVRMERQVKASKANATWAAYACDWKVWEAWTGQNGAACLPADPSAVATFLSDMSATRKITTLKRYLASISVKHTLAGLEFDRRHRDIRTIMKGISRESAPRRQVKPLMAAQVRSLLAEMGDTLPDLRDAAILALGVASGRRRSELAQLDWMTRGDGEGVFELTDDGAVMCLYKSKTQQGGDVVETYYIKLGIALAAVKRWAAVAGIAPGTPLFRSINNKSSPSIERLNGRTVARIVKARCAAAGLDPDHFSGHSLRAGMITSAAEADIPEWRIKMASGHKSDVVKGYIRPVEKKKHAIEIGL